MSRSVRPHAAPENVYVVAEIPGYGVLAAACLTAYIPTGKPGYAYGCKLTVLDGTTLAGTILINSGTTTSAVWSAAGSGSGVVNVTGSSLALTVAAHDRRTVTLNNATGCAITLPDATLPATLGALFTIVIGTTITTTSVVTITRDGTSTFHGQILQLADAGATVAAYELPGSTIITLGTSANTTGGTKGDRIQLECTSSGIWTVQGWTTAAGAEATPVT